MMGGMGKKTKKIHARKNAKRKKSFIEEDKEKNIFMQRKGLIVTFI